MGALQPQPHLELFESFKRAQERLEELIAPKRRVRVYFNAQQELPSLSTLIQREELLMQICISHTSVQLLVALIAPQLDRISMWVANEELPAVYDEHEDVYLFELPLSQLSLGLSCELLFAGERSPRFTLIPTAQDC